MKSQGNAGAAQAFGARLRAAMTAAGHVSRGSRSGVDVAKLAAAATTSYEMARRYAEGVAIPRPDKMAAITKWLGVPESALAFDAASRPVEIDERILQTCLEAVTTAAKKAGRPLSAEKAARLVAVLYQEALKGEIPGQPAVELMIKATA